jgi:hypothetical protein
MELSQLEEDLESCQFDKSIENSIKEASSSVKALHTAALQGIEVIRTDMNRCLNEAEQRMEKYFQEVLVIITSRVDCLT